MRIKRSKYSKNLIAVLICVLVVFSFWFIHFIRIKANPLAQVRFIADTIIDLSGIDLFGDTTLYTLSDSECDLLTINGSSLSVDIPDTSNFTLATATNNVLGLTPSGGTVSLIFSSGYFSSGYVSQWEEEGSISDLKVDHIVGVPKANTWYDIKVDDTLFNSFKSDASRELTFTYDAGYPSKVFTFAVEESIPISLTKSVQVIYPAAILRTAASSFFTFPTWLLFIGLIFFIILFFRKRSQPKANPPKAENPHPDGTFNVPDRKVVSFIILFALAFIACLSIISLRFIRAFETVKPGDTLTYKIAYENTSETDAEDVAIIDSIPNGASYVSGSLNINGTSKTNDLDSDEADFNQSNFNACTFNLKTIAQGSSGYVSFQIKVNDPAETEEIINQAQARWHIWSVFSNQVKNPVETILPPPPPPEEKIPPTEPLGPEEVPPVITKPIPTEKVPKVEVPEVVVPPVVPKKTLAEFYEKNIIQNKAIQTGIRAAAVPVITATSIGITALTIATTSIAFGPYLIYLWQFLVSPLSMLSARRRKAWGVVYNSLTKQPVDLAMVRLWDAQTKKLLKTRVTGRDGRYMFLVEAGKEYYVTVTKPDYEFPCKILEKAEKDAMYQDLYYGQPITIKPELTQVQRKEGKIVLPQEVVNLNIPLDHNPNTVFVPGLTYGSKTKISYLSDLLGLSREERIKENQALIASYRKVHQRRILSNLGPVLGFVCFILSPSLYTILLFVAQLLACFLFRRLALSYEPKAWGKVKEERTKKGLPLAIIRLFDKRYGRLLLTKVTPAQGRYGFLVGKENYILTCEKEGYQAPPKLEILGTKEGIVRKDVEMRRV